MSHKETIQFLTELGGKHFVDDLKIYDKQIKQLDRQFKLKKRNSGSWMALGSVLEITPFDYGARLRCQNGWVEILWVAVDCVRVRLRTRDGDFHEPFSYALVKRTDPSVIVIEVIDEPAYLVLRSGNLICRIDKQNSKIRFGANNRRLLCADKTGMQWRADGSVRLSMLLQPDENCFGLGQRAFGLQLRGKRLGLWNREAANYGRSSDPLYYSVPFYLGIHGQGCYGLLWDNASRGNVDLGFTKHDELTFEGESGELRYYMFGGDDLKQVLGRFTELTGRIDLPPLWSLGYHQSRFSYFSQESVVKLARDFRSHNIPCDAIHLDIHYMNDYRTFTWDQGAFPNPQGMLDDLHSMGFKVVPVLTPGIKVDPQEAIYRNGVQEDIFLTYPNKHPSAGVLWSGMCYFPDFTRLKARLWWQKQLVPLIRSGIDGIWNDMSEPTIFTQDGAQTLPDYVVHNGDGQGGDHVELHNVYGMLMARSSVEALKEYQPERRPFNLTRSGYAGAQQYAVSWTGNNSSTWDDLRLSISMVLNMGLSGAPMSGSNVGGFRGDCDAELFTRWVQAASLLPFFRSHTALDTHPQEPWSYGQPYEVVNRLAIELRYKLLPYLYSVIAQCREYGWPIVQPIFMAEPNNTALRSVDDCYLLGDALLVAPVLEAGAVRRSVYLPVGNWYDYWTNELLVGGREIEVAAPLERLPLFVKAGAVLPMSSVRPFISSEGLDDLTYRVYPGNLENIQYEDRGEGFEYVSGDYRWIYTTCYWEEGRLFIDRRVAGRFTPRYKQIKLEIVGFDEEPIEVRVDRQGAPLWFYDAGLLELTVDNFQRIEVVRRPQPSDRTLIRRPW